MKIFDGASVYSYERDDVPRRRVGFKAQEIQANVPKEISNLVFMSYERDQPLLALDYSRIAATVLWAQCKAQQTALQELTQRVAGLEASQAAGAASVGATQRAILTRRTAACVPPAEREPSCRASRCPAA